MIQDKVLGPKGWEESDRLKALEAYDILDTPLEKDFDDIARVAALVLKMPISVVNFIAEKRQWFKAEVGLGVRETPLDVAICTHAILQRGLFVVPDTTLDERFRDNPLVTGEPHLRFYAGALLETPEGLPLGTMCVLDYQPREFSEQEGFVLQSLARQVMTQLELRRALRERNKSDERLRLALDSSGFVGTYDWDIVNDRVYADKRFAAIFGGEPFWTTEGAPVADYLHSIHPDDRERVRERIESAMAGDGFFREEYRLVQKDGSVRWIEAIGRCRFDAAHRPLRFPGVGVEITDRKVAEEKIRDAAARFRFLAESMPQKIFTAKASGEVDYFNHQWMEFTGYTFEEIRDWGWTRFIHPDDLEENLRRWKESVEKKSVFEMENRFRRRDGVYRWHLSRAHPMRGRDGELMMWIGSNTDIDDQRRASDVLEKTVVERTAKLQSTVEELEAFSYSISHDMRAPLRAMSGFAEILREDYGSQLDDEGRSYLERIATASGRMDELIRDVLSFSQISRTEIRLERVETDPLLREIIESYPNLASASLEVRITGPLPPVLAHEAALTQCLSNILGNAVKFVRPGEKPRVEIWAEQTGDRVKLWFRDNGIGIDAHEQERIFKIFHRANRSQEGTGIGLAIVKKAMERMEGSVGVVSQPGAGASFWLDLKLA